MDELTPLPDGDALAEYRDTWICALGTVHYLDPGEDSRECFCVEATWE